MIANLVGIFRALFWTLAVVGIGFLGIAGLVAWPVRQLPELASVSETARSADRVDVPILNRFRARDGTDLAFRQYAAGTDPERPIAILIHGSSASSVAVHSLGKKLASLGIETFAPDVRGHGASGSRGDIAYIGQLEDDLTDLVGEIRKLRPKAPIILIGHSSGGGFALRIAGSTIQQLFERTVLLAPYLGYSAPSSRQENGGWAAPDIPRFIGLSILHRLGIICCESLPAIAFAVPRNLTGILVSHYSYRLMRNFAASDFRADFRAARKPISVVAGASDELMISDKYKEAVGENVSVTLIPDVNHMGIVSDSLAVSAIANEVAASFSLDRR